MGRPKGGTNRRWTDEERLKYVLMCEEDHMPICTVAKEYGVAEGTLRQWVKRFRSGGREALNPKKLRTGNHFAALHTSKSLTENERLLLLVEKLQIENERLKKGYMVKGVGADKVFVTDRHIKGSVSDN